MLAFCGASASDPSMDIFRAPWREATGGELLERARHRLSRTHPVPESELRRLLAVGELECALADHLHPDQDASSPPLRAARRLLLAAALDWLSAEAGGPAPEVDAGLAAHWDLVARATQNRIFSVFQPEGFAFYGLHPRAYATSAQNWLRSASSSPRPPGHVVVLGLRTIGGVLGAVAAAVVAQAGIRTEFYTLRPRGAPENRYYAISPELEAALLSGQPEYLLVDEGPGLSGSSFGGLTAWLQAHGVAPVRWCLFPSWDPPPERLRRSQVARHWTSWRKFPAPMPAPPQRNMQDLSGGRWRERVSLPRRAPVWPQHERAKYLSSDGRWLWKFAGLGEVGETAAMHSRELARAGFGDAACYEGHGWLRLPWRLAHPVPSHGCALAVFAAWTGRYIAARSAFFKVAGPCPPALPLREMSRANCLKIAAGDDIEPIFTPHLRARYPRLSWTSSKVEGWILKAWHSLPLPDGPCARLDGRLQTWEWGQISSGWIKFDALDHGDDHFYPGPADPAWDLAGFQVEFGPGAGQSALASYIRASGDFGVCQRLLWYRVAYLAFQTGLAHYGEELAPPPDAARFRRCRRRYAGLLFTALNQSAASVSFSLNGRVAL